MKDFTATIVEESPRAADWIKVLGSREAELKHPLPKIGYFPEIGAKQFYELDIPALSEDQRARLVEHLSQRFKVPHAEVEAELDKVGCPILAEDVIITIKNPGRWL